MDIRLGDTLVMKKPHPCGEKRWQVDDPPPESGKKHPLRGKTAGTSEIKTVPRPSQKS